MGLKISTMKRIKTKEELDELMANYVHLFGRDFRCLKCDKVIMADKNGGHRRMEEHFMVRHTTKVNRPVCKVCGARPKHEFYMMRHMKQRHKDVYLAELAMKKEIEKKEDEKFFG